MAKLLKYDKNGEEAITSTGRQHNPSRDIPISEINRKGEEQNIFEDDIIDVSNYKEVDIQESGKKEFDTAGEV